MAINYWITELIHSIDNHPTANFALKLINEFTLSTSSKQAILSEADLVVIDFGGIKAVLSGSTDYTLLVKPVARPNLRKDVVQLTGKFLS